MTDLNAVATLIYDTLTGDAPLMALLPGGVHRNSAPQRAAQDDTPVDTYAVFQILGAGSVIANDRTRIFSMPLVRILVHGEGCGPNAVDGAVERIDELLEAVRGTAGDKHIRGFHRVNAIEDPYQLGGVDYERSGADYQAFVYDAP